MATSTKAQAARAKATGKTKAAVYSAARKQAIKKLIQLHKADWDRIWGVEAMRIGITTHTSVRKRRAYTLEQRIKKLKKELAELNVS